MTAELLAYIFVFIATLYYCGKFGENNRRDFLIFFLLLGYSITTRNSGFDGDIYATYSGRLSTPLIRVFLNFGYLREFVYWGGSNLIFKIIGSAELTFILMDAISFLCLIKVRRNLNLPYYFVPIFVLFFPALLGLQNAYRQYIAICVFLLGFSSTGKTKWFYFFVAAFCHNAVIVFGPLMLLKEHHNLKLRIPLLVIGAVMVFGLLKLAASTKAVHSTGLNLTVVYAIMSIVMFSIYAISLDLKFVGIEVKYLSIFTYLMLLTILSNILINEAQAERLSMMVLQILLPILILLIDNRYKEKLLTRVLFVVLATAPTFLFQSALTKLTT